jgi:tetratricopeptide (TPR) repeat protein
MSRQPVAFTHEQLEQLLWEMVAEVLAHEDFEQFLTWMRANAHLHFGHLPFVDEDGPRAMAAMVARTFWNHMPLPGNGFKPRPVAAPGRNDPCPCGSGAKYKTCCAQLPQFDAFDEDELWAAMAQQLPAAQLRKAIETKRMPPVALAEAARRELDVQAPKKAVNLLQPLFEGELARCDERYEPALDALCDAYQALGHDRKRLLFLEQVAQQCKGSLAAAAWQRLAAMRMDRGDHEGAWEAFRGAQKADPDSPSLALNEVTLLLGERRGDEAAARARFYVARFRKLGFDDEGWLDSLEAVARDPHAALADMNMESAGVDVERLRTWLDACVARPLPKYEVQPLLEIDPENETEMLAHLRRQLSAMGVPAPELNKIARKMARDLKRQKLEREKSERQEKLFPGDSTVEDAHANERVLSTPPDLASLEAQWREVYLGEEPFSVSSGMVEGAEAWDPGAVEDWLAFLEAHPEAGDSLEIIDDVATALSAFDSQLPQGAGFGLAPALAERGCAIVVHAAGEADVELPWGCVENRPGLRLFATAIHSCLDRNETDRATALMRTLLRLNPNDNHGFRALLINQLLRVDDTAAALELIARYPDDMMVEMRYGAALAHFRRGEQALAREALQIALTSNAHVPTFLIKERITKPRMNPETVAMGGRDEAWLYREDAREVWQATPGALEWLKTATSAARR